MTPVNLSISARDYYELLPTPPLRTGDIWTNLPTFGLLKQPFCSGVIVTPACDLVNCKTDTVSYLPIIDLDNIFYYKFFYQKVRELLLELFKNNNIPNLFDTFSKHLIPDNDSIIDALALLKDSVRQDIYDKVKLGLEHIMAINDNKVQVDLTKLSSFFGTQKWSRILSGLVKNSFSSDIHFLPADGQPRECSGVPKHSAVLFRYPITIPIDVLYIADDPFKYDWDKSIGELHEDYSLYRFFEKKPLRTSRLKKDYIAELLTRYLSLYIRMGSPDFTDDTVKLYSSEIGGL